MVQKYWGFGSAELEEDILQVSQLREDMPVGDEFERIAIGAVDGFQGEMFLPVHT